MSMKMNDNGSRIPSEALDRATADEIERLCEVNKNSQDYVFKLLEERKRLREENKRLKERLQYFEAMTTGALHKAIDKAIEAKHNSQGYGATREVEG